MSDEDKSPAPQGEPSAEPQAGESAVPSASSPDVGSPETAPTRPPKGGVGKGIGILALLHLLLIVYPVAYFGIGIVQLLYVIPAAIYFRKQTGVMQGILIGAGITFLLNAACFGLVLNSFS